MYFHDDDDDDDDDDDSEIDLKFQLISNTFTKRTGDTETIISYKFKRLSDEIIKPPATSGNGLTPKLKWSQNSKIVKEFKGSWLRQDNTTFTHGNVVFSLLSMKKDMVKRFKYKVCSRWLFGPMILTKNADPNRYRYFGFDACLSISLPICDWGKNVVILAKDNDLSKYTDNNK